LVGAIGHEIAHIIALDGKISISKSDLYSVLRNREESAKSKEKRAETVYKFFKEPVLSEIVKWDYISMQKETEEIVSKDVLLVSQQNFDRLVFKEKLEKYHDFIRSKLAESEQRM
jgi:deoxyadenosine/deoxycytidine kinase